MKTFQRKGAKAQRGRKADGAREAAKSAKEKRERNTVARGHSGTEGGGWEIVKS